VSEFRLIYDRDGYCFFMNKDVVN